MYVYVGNKNITSETDKSMIKDSDLHKQCSVNTMYASHSYCYLQTHAFTHICTCTYPPSAGGFSLPCEVLTNSTGVTSTRGLQNFFRAFPCTILFSLLFHLVFPAREVEVSGVLEPTPLGDMNADSLLFEASLGVIGVA